MKKAKADLVQIQTKENMINTDSLIVDSSINKSPAYFNDLNFYLSFFKRVPNIICQSYIDCKRAAEWLTGEYRQEIQDIYFQKVLRKRSKRLEFEDVFFVLFNDLIISFDVTFERVRYMYRDTDNQVIENILCSISRFKAKKERIDQSILLLAMSQHGIETKSLSVKKPKFNLADNYNDDFAEVHRIILKRLSMKNNKGIVLLHGKPGTGKTSYIRYLVCSVKKNIIFLPPNMASSLTSPNLVSVLIDNPNSIFVIEDAENIVIDREHDGESPVSALLNIADGLLSDCLNIQIICSFNTDISKIDSALLRKGRLIAKYEFKELETEKANHLSQKLGFQSKLYSPMTLSAIYNQDENDFIDQKIKSPVGFRVIQDN